MFRWVRLLPFRISSHLSWWKRKKIEEVKIERHGKIPTRLVRLVKVDISAVKEIAPCSWIRIPDLGQFLLMDSGILGFQFRNTAQGILNPTNSCNPESKFHRQRIRNEVPGIRKSRCGKSTTDIQGQK